MSESEVQRSLYNVEFIFELATLSSSAIAYAEDEAQDIARDIICHELGIDCAVFEQVQEVNIVFIEFVEEY